MYLAVVFYTHTHIYIYIYVCVCVRARALNSEASTKYLVSNFIYYF